MREGGQSGGRGKERRRSWRKKIYLTDTEQLECLHGPFKGEALF